MSPWLVFILLLALVVQRLLELRVAKRNEAWARARGAKEFGRSHYPLFFFLHIGWMLGIAYEGYQRAASWEYWHIPLLLSLLAQYIRYKAITDLGPYWNTRILVIAEARPVTSGIYRFVRHPNYIAVAIELASLPLVFGAYLTALVATLLNGLLLLLIRIPAEEKALGLMIGPEKTAGSGDSSERPT